MISDDFLIVSDYKMTDGVCTFVIPKLEGITLDKIYLVHSRKKIIYEKTKLCFHEEEQAYVFCVDLKDSGICVGTWYPIAVTGDEEYYFQYRDFRNDTKTGKLIELSNEKLFFDPETKTHYMGAISPESRFSIRKWKNASRGIKKYTAGLINCTSEGRTIRMQFTNKINKKIQQAEMWAWNRFAKTIVRMDVNMEEEDNVFAIDFSVHDIINNYSTCREKNWELFLALNMNGTYCQFRFGFNNTRVNSVKLDESERYVLSENIYEADGSCEWVFQFYFNNISKFIARVNPRNMMYRGMYRAEINDFYLKGTRLVFKIRQSNHNFENRRVILRHIDDQTGEPGEYGFSFDGFNGEYELHSIDYKDVVLTPLRYEVIMLGEKDSYTYEFRIIGTGNKYRKRLSKMYKNSYTNEDGLIIYVTETMGDKLVIECRKRNGYDDLKYRIKEEISMFLRPFAALITKKKKYLMFYEKFCTAAQDNSYWLFRYFMKHPKPGIIPVYVLEKQRPEYKLMKKEFGRNVVPFMSIRHLTDIQIAEAFISTDSRRHCYRWRSGYTPIMQRISQKKFVFLQHGVVGFKKVDNIYGKQFANKANIFVSVSEFERNIIEKNFGYNKGEIKITGLARWDVLENKLQNPPMIFCMPTWRNWIYEADTEKFLESEFFEMYYNLINSDRLIDILEKNNLNMVFCLHPKFKDYSETLSSKSDRISIVDYTTCHINEMLMECSLFVTDYSSASWDVYYLEKPVLFYQFDWKEYMEKQGSYIDLKKQVFGYRVTTLDEFITKLNEVIKNNFADREDSKELRHRFIPICDKNNCKRIYKEIMKMLRK